MISSTTLVLLLQTVESASEQFARQQVLAPAKLTES